MNAKGNISGRISSIFGGEIRDNRIVKILIAIVLVIITTMMFPHPESIDYSYNIGAVWADKDLIAPFSFPVYKDLRQYEKEQLAAVRNVYPVFERRDVIAQQRLDSARMIIQSLRLAANKRLLWKKRHDSQDSLAFAEITHSLPFSLSPDEWMFLIQSSSRGAISGKTDTVLGEIPTSLSDIYHVGILDQADLKQPHSYFALRKGMMEEIIPFEKVYTLEDAVGVLSSRFSVANGNPPEHAIALKIIRAVLAPNFVYNQVEMNRAIQLAEENVPRTLGFVLEKEHVISKDDRITEEVKLKLDSFRKAKAERGSEYIEWRHWTGIFLHVTLIMSLFGLYVFLFRKKIFHDNGKLTLIALLILMEIGFAYLSLTLNLTVPTQYLIFVPAASMLFAIIFDSRVAFYGTVTIAFLIAGIRGNDYVIALTSLVPGALGAYSVRDIRNRTQIFRSLIFIFLGYAVAIVALSLEEFESFSAISTQLTFALANAVISPVLTYGLLIFFEHVFNVTTDLTLLELSDFNQPLLRQLSEKAPGTFHHSMTIGNLAEAAAEAIAANSILARVGGYYHDIGKMGKPEYFVENQTGVHSRHNRLKPRMSALIIQSHVKDGIELAREHELPEKIIDFIPQHHGTTLISFFYDKALKQAAKRPDKANVQEEDFRYPGPKPQTKETGIVMLADSVEASTRAITEMTPQKLEQSIDSMIKQRFSEGQLDECDLTLRDLTKIKEAFEKILQKASYFKGGLRKIEAARAIASHMDPS
ncbi:MAG: HDIG domain-containing protein, partial [Ignavibacteriales bacterium]|nr:HDIG domain-containing protein [Ignavibacteriales bacterium]